MTVGPAIGTIPASPSVSRRRTAVRHVAGDRPRAGGSVGPGQALRGQWGARSGALRTPKMGSAHRQRLAAMAEVDQALSVRSDAA